MSKKRNKNQSKKQWIKELNKNDKYWRKNLIREINEEYRRKKNKTEYDIGFYVKEYKCNGSIVRANNEKQAWDLYDQKIMSTPVSCGIIKY